MTRTGKGRTYMTVYVSDALAKRLTRLARAKDVSRSKLAEQLLADGVEHEETMVAAMTDPVVMPAIMKALAEPSVLASMMRAMRADLSDDQLQLFEKQIAAAQAVADPKPPPARRKGSK
jgi:hypothetical protein